MLGTWSSSEANSRGDRTSKVIGVSAVTVALRSPLSSSESSPTYAPGPTSAILLVLMLLIAIATGTVLTAAAGARRGDSSVDRLLAETLPAHAAVTPFEPGFEWDAVRALPQVEGLGLLATGRYTINGVGDPAETIYVIPADDQAMQAVDRPVVLAGRLADPSKPDEAVVTARYAELNGLTVGDTREFGLYRPETIDPAGVFQLPPVADGPSLTVRVVGVVRSFFFADELGGPGRILPSVALFNQFKPNMLGDELTSDYLGLVRLRGGTAAIPEFRPELARVTDGRTSASPARRRTGTPTTSCASRRSRCLPSVLPRWWPRSRSSGSPSSATPPARYPSCACCAASA